MTTTLPPTTDSIKKACAILKTGGVVIHPTETCYGLACDLTNPDAVAKLFALKQRPTNQPVSALLSSLEEAKKYVEWSEKAEELARAYLPGPLTLILPVRKDTPHVLYTTPHIPAPTVGIRISSHPLAQQLAETYGKPLSTTSVNIAGKPACYSVKEVEEQFGKLDDGVAVIHGEVLERKPPSRIVSLVNGHMKELR